MENTPFKAFQVPPIPRSIGTATYILYYNPLLKRITYGLPGSSYSLPTASGSVLGGVKIGTGLSIDGSGVLSATGGGYTLPIASSTVLGGIKIGSGLSIDPSTGIVTAAGTYSLPIATASVLGGVKVGTGLSIDSATGVLSATGGGYSLPIASASILGGIKVGTGLSIDGSGVLSATAYTLPIASASVLGGIKVGTGLSIDVNGVLSATGGTGSQTWQQTLLVTNGSILTQSNTVTMSTFTLNFSGTAAGAGSVLNVTNTSSGHAIIGTASGAGYGVFGTGFRGVLGTSSSRAVEADATSSGIAFYARSFDGSGLSINQTPATFNNLSTVIDISRFTSGNSQFGANGIGTSITFSAPTTASTGATGGGSFDWKWSDATTATRTGQFDFRLVKNAGALTTILSILGEGGIQLTGATTIPTPPAGSGALAVKTDGNLYYKKPDGTEIQLN